MKENLVRDKSYLFALSIIELYKVLVEKNEFVMSKQVLKSGTSIGANIEEALAGQSRPDFLSKMSIASKEARETLYWLRLLRDSNTLAPEQLVDLIDESESLINILTSIVKNTAIKKA